MWPTIEGAEILAVGDDLKVPAGDYRVLPPGDASDLGDGRAVFEELAAAHGAVVFQLVVSWADEPQPGVLLRVELAWAVLEQATGSIGVPTIAALDGTARYIALLADGMEGDGDLVVRVGFVLEEREHRGTWSSEHWRLHDHRALRYAPQRDWPWRWGESTIGPIELIVRLARTADEVATWLATLAPMPYVLRDPGRYSSPRDDDRLEIRISDGRLALLRSYHAPRDQFVAFDGGLVRALADGALGELSWDLLDGDWGAILATGEDRASLATYLDPEVDPAALEAHYRAALVAHHCDALAATTREEVHAILARVSPRADHAVVGAHAVTQQPLASGLLTHRLASSSKMTLPSALGPSGAASIGMT